MEDARPEDLWSGHSESIEISTFRNDDTLIDTTPPEYAGGTTTRGGTAETSFSTGKIDAYGKPMTTAIKLAYVEGEYKDVFDTSRMEVSKHKLLASAVNDYYKMLAQDQNIAPEFPVLDNFEFDSENKLRLKGYPYLNLINEDTGRSNQLTTVAGRRGGWEIVKKGLGFSRWNPEMSKEAKQQLLKSKQQMSNAASTMATAPIEESEQAADEAVKSAQKILAVLTSEGYTSRDILGMCKSLERSRGELINNLAKLSELDKDIALEERKLEETTDEAEKEKITERLSKLQNERAARLEDASANREALRSQVNRIRETLHRILHEDKTLAERIKTLFREQGITIATVLTAIGMTISTIVLAIPGVSGGGGAAPPQPPGKGGAKEWIKKQLQSLGRILAKLAGKAAAALPGIIGLIVSWLLSLLGKTVVWLAGNLWAVLLAVGGLLLLAAREWLLPKKPKQS